ncbi:MAG: hypothetical protein AUK47_23320 [Deltaproteobacteria bacterium CG2_30_63_29]|nr:MAG: hypothetical protein AUK47_23320 [Deltaproteobacteria bacterium CG2_30_63_29]
MAIKIKKKVEKAEEELEVVSEDLAEPDKFVTTSLNVSSWVKRNQKQLALGVGAVLVLTIGISIYMSHLKTQKVEASSALTSALDASMTPTRSEVEERRILLQIQYPDIDPNLANYRNMFKDDEARNQAVLAASLGALDKFGDSEITGEAHLLAAAAAQRLGDIELAETHADQALEKLDESVDIFALQTKAVALMDNGSYDEAVSAYRQILNSSPRFYGPFALMQIAGIHEKAGQLDAAAAAYAELVAKFPEDPTSADAERSLGFLVEDPDKLIAAVPND